MIKIDKKIVGYAVNQSAAEEKEGKREFKREGGGDRAEVIRMHERLERPEMLVGSTYKVKTPVSDHAMYVTVNDIILNEGTEHEKRRPFEIFINS
ncbi:MAG TPA: NrdJb, partial [Woeseiaceae bacterium]|nr:NrdJb [Woeseiaceae bacterium]